MKKVSTKLLLNNLKEAFEDLNKAKEEYSKDPTPENEQKIKNIQERGMGIERKLELLSENENYASIKDYQLK